MPDNPHGATAIRHVRSMTKASDALEFRLQGWSYVNIGVELGLSSRQAYVLVRQALDEVRFENQERAAELRDTIIARNDEVIVNLFPKAVAGDLFAIDRLLKVQDQSASLAGAYPRVQQGPGGDETMSGPIIVLPAVLDGDADVPVTTLPPGVVQGSLATAEPIDAVYVSVDVEPE